jgi:hypothetical protein
MDQSLALITAIPRKSKQVQLPYTTFPSECNLRDLRLEFPATWNLHGHVNLEELQALLIHPHAHRAAPHLVHAHQERLE